VTWTPLEGSVTETFFVFAMYLVPSFPNVSGLPFFVARFDLLQRLATNIIGMM
jgi:hypothetical protein